MKTLGRFLSGLILGSIAGSLLALLLTPASGNDVRKRVKDNILYVKNEVQSAARERSEELKKELARLQQKV
jgi:gas vesicle protein